MRKFLIVLESSQRFSKDQFSNHKEERKSAEVLSSSTSSYHNNVSLVFSTWIGRQIFV